ncbi:MAG: putative O-antigen polymerase, partial [Verrucomicrobiales bacterium]|nr:putative O-antigen polymerase [Verrucomicrobiales bacterium]
IFAMNTGHGRNEVNTGFFRLVCGFIAICLFVRSLDELKIIRKLLIFLALMTSGWVLKHGGHGPGMLIDENDAAMGMIVLLPFTYFFISSEKKFYMKAISLFAFFLTLIAIASTVSRGGMVGTLPSLFFIWMKAKHKVASLAVIILMLIVTVLTGPANLISEFESIQDTHESTAASRIFFWGLSTQLFLARPIAGVGPGSWETAVWSGIIPVPGQVSNRTPHSLYFQLISEMGLVGVFAWGGLVVATFMTVLSLSRKKLDRHAGVVMSALKGRQSDLAQFIGNKAMVNTFANALLISVIGFLLSSAFLSVLFYPQLFVIAALAHVLKRCWESEISLALYLGKSRTPQAA